MTSRHLLCIVAMLAVCVACGRTSRTAHVEHHESASPDETVETVEDGVCVLQSTSGSQATGVVRFHEQEGILIITATIKGLLPGSKHAMHIHELGDMRSADGSAVGGHYNPAGHEHGGPESKQHHAGDLGNIAADGAGEAHVELRVDDMGVAEIVGRSVVVHANEDDLTSQPAGKAGPRIAVGVIGLAQSE